MGKASLNTGDAGGCAVSAVIPSRTGSGFLTALVVAGVAAAVARKRQLATNKENA